jgi:hypothetical protein
MAHQVIRHSVGKGGKNISSDVKIIQRLLNTSQIRARKEKLTEDGVCGARTSREILNFQLLNTAFSDGLIAPTGQTLLALLKTAKTSTSFQKTLPEKSKSGTGSTFEWERLARYLKLPFSMIANDHQAKLAWGKSVSKEFKEKVISISATLKVDPNYLMACMAFETGETFSPSIKNGAGSGAVGLIQFMPSTAKALGTTTSALANMSAVQQLDYVLKYFSPKSGKLKSLDDVYMAILYPAAVGKPSDYTLFESGTKSYEQNKGFDSNNDKKITPSEVSSKVRALYEKGLLENYAE